MQKLSKAFAVNSRRLCLNIPHRRTFLPESYYCYEEWDKYLTSGLMKKTGTVNSFSIELDEKLKEKSLVTPLDMEILATKTVQINNFQELDFIENIFLNFRKTQTALYVRDSMHYALIRSYLDLNQPDRLLKLLKLKYKYGIFADCYTANMLMDAFIKQNEYTNAALAAHEVMLQEIDVNELSIAACVLSCVQCSKNALDGYVQSEEQETTNQESKRLVYFKRKEWEDDHFDLKSVRQLNGKTIWWASMQLQAQGHSLEKSLINSLKIYGLILWSRINDAVALFENVLMDERGQLYSFLIQEMNNEIARKAMKDSEITQKWADMKALCEKSSEDQLLKDDIVQPLQELVQSLVASQAERDAESQKFKMAQWEKNQAIEVEEQTRRFAVELKKSSIERRLSELERQEELLTYFDRKQQISNAYHNRGFGDEDPELIPVQPEEATFANKFERHFKPHQKYANRAPPDLKIERDKQDVIDSLRKIYFDNKQAQTNYEPKLASKN